VVPVSWKANYENPKRFAAAHFLAAHSINKCLRPSASHFPFEIFVILYTPEEIIHKLICNMGRPILGSSHLPIIGGNICSRKRLNKAGLVFVTMARFSD
jgi:hypothetical protein